MKPRSLLRSLPLAALCLALPGLAQPLERVEDEKAEPRAGATDIGDPYYPGLGGGGYDALHYDLVLDVDMEARSIQATTTIRARALHGLTSFNLDLVGLNVDAITVDGKEATFEHEGRELTITPRKPIARDAEFVTVIAYSGEPAPAEDASHRDGVGWHSLPTGIYVMSECVGAASWFPCNDHQRDKATFTIDVTAPKPYTAAANGLIVEEEDLGSARRWKFSAKQPMAPYLVTLNVAEFDVVMDEGRDGLPILNYYPTDMTNVERAPFEKQAEMIEFFEFCFGPYPFESSGAIVSYEFLGGALETQTRPVYSRGMPESVVAHELAHQWFGDCVSADNWNDMWLNEGFATYGAFLWTEYADGPDRFENDMRRNYSMLRRAEISSPLDPGVERVFSASSYQRGAHVLHCLRLEVGDDVFFDILQQWVVDNYMATGTTAEFLALCEEKAGRDLDELFAGVLQAEVVPEDERFE
jgi:aminopeptidase N